MLSDCTRKECTYCTDADCTEASHIVVTQEECPEGEQCVIVDDVPSCTDGRHLDLI